MIEFPCACGKLLGVGEELAGKRVRCPACRKVVDVPVVGPTPFPGSPRSGTHDSSPSVAEYAGPFAAVLAPTPAFAGATRTSTAAVFGMILGLFGCACLPVPLGLGLSIAGLVFISRSPQSLSGTGFAIAGLVLNTMWILFFVGSFLLAPVAAPPEPVTPPIPTSSPIPLTTPAPACGDNLRNLYTIVDTYLAAKKDYPPGAGARFLDQVEHYGRSNFPRLKFSIRAPGGAHAERTAYRGPARPLRKDMPAHTPIIADWADEHADGSLHVLYADGTVETLFPGSPNFSAALEGTQ